MNVTMRAALGGLVLLAPGRLPIRFCSWCDRNYSGPHLCQRRPPYPAEEGGAAPVPSTNENGAPDAVRYVRGGIDVGASPED